MSQQFPIAGTGSNVTLDYTVDPKSVNPETLIIVSGTVGTAIFTLSVSVDGTTDTYVIEASVSAINAVFSWIASRPLPKGTRIKLLVTTRDAATDINVGASGSLINRTAS